MFVRQIARVIRTALFVSLAAMLLYGQAALAQANLRATDVGETSVTLEWDAVPSATHYGISQGGQGIAYIPDPSQTSYTVTGLEPDTKYTFTLGWQGGQDTIDVRTAGNPKKLKPKSGKSKPKEPESDQHQAPPIPTCPYLPPNVEVFGYVRGTQCQTVGLAGVGNMDVIKRGFIDAVDIWSYVNGGLEVCFRQAGWLVFLDAAYAPRMVVELDAFQREDMTCGAIDGPGTVVMVRSAPPSAAAAPPAADAPPPAADAAPPAADASPAPGEPTLPTFDAIPLNDCLIKLVETLFLRAEPAGEIIGLVWQFSEVPAFEISGYWYKIEFEGQSGYVSRYHRTVLRGGCG